MYNREKVDNGILQKFIEPKGTCNMMLRGVWSPKIVLCERRESLRRLTDSNYSLYELVISTKSCFANCVTKSNKSSSL